MVSGSKKEWREGREKRWGGSYNYIEVLNDRKVYKVSFKDMKAVCNIWKYNKSFQCEEESESGNYYYLWYNDEKTRWQLNDESDHKRDECLMYLQSTGEK